MQEPQCVHFIIKLNAKHICYFCYRRRLRLRWEVPIPTARNGTGKDTCNCKEQDVTYTWQMYLVLFSANRFDKHWYFKFHPHGNNKCQLFSLSTLLGSIAITSSLRVLLVQIQRQKTRTHSLHNIS